MNVRSLCALGLLTLFVASDASAQGLSDIERVRTLYVAAAYEEALAAMPPNATGVVGRDLEQYRALCLLALGREPEAVAAIERIVKADPTYLPTRDTSPRMRGMFAEVRSKLVPDMARAIYADAKASFDAHDIIAAQNGFRRTIDVIDSLPQEDKVALDDLRVLVSGFIDLLMARPGSPQPEPVPGLPAIPDVAAEFVGPVPIREQLPVWTPPDTAAKNREYVGLLRVDIGDDGRVRNAVMIESTHPVYDAAAVRAAKTWTYKPAMRGGKPVATQKDVRIRLLPR
jgi:TonB family protein